MKAEIKEVDVPTEKIVLTMDIVDAQNLADAILNQRWHSYSFERCA